MLFFFSFAGGVSDGSFSLIATHWKVGFPQSASSHCDSSSLTDCFMLSVNLNQVSNTAANTSDESGLIPSKPHLLMIDSLTAVLNATILAESPSSQFMLVNTLCIVGKMQHLSFCTKKMFATYNCSSNLANSSNKTHWWAMRLRVWSCLLVMVESESTTEISH